MKSIITEIEWFSVDDLLPPEGVGVLVKEIREVCFLEPSPVSNYRWVWYLGKNFCNAELYKLWAFKDDE